MRHSPVKKAEQVNERISLKVRADPTTNSVLRRTRLLLPILCVVLVTSCGYGQESHPTHAPAGSSTQQGPPNILFILVDDLGKEWLQSYGGEGPDMPNLSRLADAGVVFDNAYVNPQCTPTRVSLLTGQYPFRHGWINHWDVPRWGHGYFDWQQNPSYARALQNAGYKTAAAGKWQVNDFRITPDAMVKHGFDDYLMWTGYETGNPPSAERYWDPYLHSKDGSRTYEGEFGEDVITDFLIDFIDANKDSPWFAYYAMSLPHVPFTNTPSADAVEDDIAKYEAMVRYTDEILGRLIDFVELSGERDETIIIWLTDNGGEPSIVGRRDGREVNGGKMLTSEAGVNVPLVIRAPAFASGDMRGSRSTALIDATDYFPTFVDLAGGRYSGDQAIDGVSFAPLLRGDSKDSSRDWIMAMGGQNRAKATLGGVENEFKYRDRVIRDERYKLYVNASPERGYLKLVDLENDPTEEVDLMDSDDEAAQAAFARLAAIAESFPAHDNDPSYKNRAASAWDVEISAESQLWKK